MKEGILMSYDVKIQVKVEGTNTYVDLNFGIYPNITWNVRELILQSSGWDIKNNDFNGTVNEWKDLIQKGYDELNSNPDKYKQYESANGWGTVKGTRSFYYDCLMLIEEMKCSYPELGDIALVYVC